MAQSRKDTISPTPQTKVRQRAEEAKKRDAARRKRALDKVRGRKTKKELEAEAARWEKEAARLRAAAKKAKRGSGFDVEYAKAAKEAAAKAAAARTKAAGKAPAPAPVAPLVGQGPLRPGESRVADTYVGAKPRPAPAGPPRPTTPAPPAAAPRPASAPAPAAGGAPAAPLAPAAAVSAGEVDAEFSKRFAHMQWAWSHPELGPVLREAAEKGYNENELTGRLFQTEWFKVHGTANAVAQLRDTADDYLVRLTDDVARRYAMQLISKELQPAEVAGWIKEQAKSRYPVLAAAIDSGVTVRQYADAYVTDTAATLEMNPEAIDLTDPKWSRFLEGATDPKTGQRTALSRYDWVTMLKSDPAYAPIYDRTRQALTGAAEFATQIRRSFGAAA